MDIRKLAMEADRIVEEIKTKNYGPADAATILTMALCRVMVEGGGTEETLIEAAKRIYPLAQRVFS